MYYFLFLPIIITYPKKYNVYIWCVSKTSLYKELLWYLPAIFCHFWIPLYIESLYCFIGKVYEKDPSDVIIVKSFIQYLLYFVIVINFIEYSDCNLWVTDLFSRTFRLLFASHYLHSLSLFKYSATKFSLSIVILSRQRSLIITILSHPLALL